MRYLSLLTLALSLPVFAQSGNLQLSSSTMAFAATAGSGIPQAQTVAVSSTGSALPVNVSIVYFSAATGWLSVTSSAAATPATLTVTADHTALVPGTYIAQVRVIASPTQSTYFLVTLTVNSAGPGGSLLTASPASVSLTSSSGIAAQSIVNVSSTGSVPFQIFTSTTTGGNWLSVNTISGTAPTSFTINANPYNLSPGVYSGIVSIAPTSGAAGVAIPVTFTVASGGTSSGFTATPAAVNFYYQTSGATPASQAVFINNTSGIISYAATASVSWIKLTSNNYSIPLQSVTGTSNSNLNILIDPTGLTPGIYSGTVNITAANAATQTVAVALSVSSTAILTASPASMAFNYQPDSGIPASQQTVIGTTGSAVSFTASATSSGWLLVGPQSGATNGSNVLTVSVSPASLPAGVYTGAINVTTGLTTISIPVTLTVGASGYNAIAASPQSLSFQAQLNSPSASQTLVLTASTAKNFLASASASGGAWLQVNPNSGGTPATLTVTITPQAVATAGIYSGLIQITNLTDSTQLSIPVTMTLSGANLGVTPSSLTYSLTAGSPTSGSQVVQLTGSTNTAYAATTDSSWLTVSPSSGAVPANLTILANAASLAAGNYTGVVTIVGGGAMASVVVSISVSASALPSITPTNLSFQYAIGGAMPPAQTIAVNSSLGPINFTATARTTSGGTNWLLATASGVTTPATISVTVQPAGLAPGTYRGVVTVTAFGSGESRSAEVVLIVAAPAAPTLRMAVHGAIRELSALTPGMILSLYGNGLGPLTGVKGTVSGAGAFETSYDGYRVLFDGIPAPLLYISNTQIDLVAPYGIAGRFSTRIEVDHAGVRSNSLELRLSPDAAPGIFTLDSSGRGQAAALNQNGSINGISNPAARDSIIVLYATGEGQTQPAGQEGRIINTDLRKPLLPVAVNVGGVACEVLYAGSAPGLVSGLMQVNVRLNADVPRGAAVPVELRVGAAPSPAGVTVAIQ